MTQLNIDSEKKQISTSFKLDGEETAIDFIIHYEFINPSKLRLIHLECSRAWIAKLANEILPSENKEFELPQHISVIFSLLK